MDCCFRTRNQSAVGSEQCLNRNDPFLNPLGPASALRRPVGTGAIYAASDDPMTVRWNLYKDRLCSISTSNGYGVHLYRGLAGGPRGTVRWNGIGGNSSHFPITMRIPTGATGGPATTGDWLVEIYDEETDLWQHFFEFQPDTARGANNYVARLRRADGPGGSGQVAGTATRISVAGACFRLADAANRTDADYRIRHGFGWALWRNKKNTDNAGVPENAAIIGRTIQWPAVAGDSNYQTENNGLIPYGANLALPPLNKGGPNIDSLGLTILGKRLAYALRDYGSFIVDGGSSLAMRGESGAQNITELREQLTILRQHLRVITNNFQNQSVSGGGDALAVAVNCGYIP